MNGYAHPRNDSRRLGDDPLLWIIPFALILFLLAFSTQLAYADAPTTVDLSTDATTGQQVVHVGFFRFDGYHDMDTAGEKSGYGYDFLQMISGYANFKYVYVGYQNSWADMLDMLDSGGIDMLTYAPKLPEYEARFDFSEHSIGSSALLLTTSVSNITFAANDYTPFDGMRIGMVEGVNRKSVLDAYMAEKGISYTPVYYADIDSIKAALQKGTDIDAMIADELRVLSDEVIIDKFDTQDLYVMVKKGNTSLLNTIDEAIRRLDAANPGWMVELTSKYFLSEYSAGLPVTLSESQYIQNLVTEDKTLEVLFNPARYPLSYYEDGEARGVLVDIFKQVADEYGLPYEFMDVGDIDEYYKLRSSGKADVVLDFAGSADEAEVLGYRLTSSYVDSNCSVITKNEFSGTPQTIAIIDGSETFYDIAKDENARAKIVRYDSFDACVDAVENGSADCTYMYSITAQMFVIEDNGNRIKTAQLNDRTFQFHLAVNTKVDMALYGLLNKAVHNLDDSAAEEAYNAYLLEAKRSYTLQDYLMENPFVAVAIVAVIFAALVGFIVIQRRNARKLEASNDALNASRDALEDALEAANDANAAKTKFLSQMSHDIRTPLNGIIGMTEIANNNIDDRTRVSDALSKIGNSSDHLLTLINDILDLNRIESGKMIMAHDPTDLRSIVSQCAEVLKSSVVNRNLEAVVECAPIEHPFILTDALHVRQILINIISNAVKFTPDGGTVRFKTECHLDTEGTHQLCKFEVADTGIGMSEEFQKRIFEAFVQADDYNARTQYKGSGLGMSIVKQFVDMLGGTIDITSKLEEGTLVVVELPFDIDSETAAVAVVTADDSEEEPDFSGLRVLLVEDNDINMEIARMMLESRGFVVDMAQDGKIAVDSFAASEPGTYQCILMDVMMPNMDGYAATRAIRALERPDAKTVPIIAMTANAFAEDVKAALDSGMNAHIAKPINPQSVMETLAKHVRR